MVNIIASFIEETSCTLSVGLPQAVSAKYSLAHVDGKLNNNLSYSRFIVKHTDDAFQAHLCLLSSHF